MKKIKIDVPILNLSLFVIFFWFGILKPLGMSPAEELVVKTVDWMPFFEPLMWVKFIGIWEVFIGIFFLFSKTIRISLVLLFLQMTGTFIPLFKLPHVCFQLSHIPYAPTLEGQYIIKNIIIIAAALLLADKKVRASIYSEN